MAYVTPFNKPYIDNTRAVNPMWNGWGIYNPTQRSTSSQSGIGGQILNDFMSADFDTQAAMWANQAVRPYLSHFVQSQGNAFINRLEPASWSKAGQFDSGKYGDLQTPMQRIKQRNQQAGAPAAGSDPYAGMTRLYRDSYGMIHDPGDNPVTQALNQLPQQGGTNTTTTNPAISQPGGAVRTAMQNGGNIYSALRSAWGNSPNGGGGRPGGGTNPGIVRGTPVQSGPGVGSRTMPNTNPLPTTSTPPPAAGGPMAPAPNTNPYNLPTHMVYSQQ